MLNKSDAANNPVEMADNENSTTKLEIAAENSLPPLTNHRIVKTRSESATSLILCKDREN